VAQRRAAQGVVQRQAGIAAKAEHHFDAMLAQHLDDGLRPGNRGGAGFDGLVHSDGYISAP